MAASGSDKFSTFYAEVKAIEQRDSKLTPKQQIDRLLRPGSTYFNLNPFEVLHIHPDTTVEDARKQYKRMSLLIHPDKNRDDRERADKAFDIIKRAIARIEDPDELDKCRQVVIEAKARTDISIEEKRKKLRREKKEPTVEEDDPDIYRKVVSGLTTKLFADGERKRKNIEERANDEKRRKAEELIELGDKKKLEDEYKKNYEESRDDRVGSWKKFQTKKEKKGKLGKGSFKPPKPRMEQR